MTAIDDKRAEEILAFWFGSLAGPYDLDVEGMPRWFKKDAAFDEEVRRRFGASLEAALRGELDEEHPPPRRRLALVLLLDQLTRNAFRDDARMYEGDARALRLSQEGVERGDDEQLRVIERAFLYMPYMHSESLADQEACVRLFEGLRQALPEAQRGSPIGGFVDNSLDYAKRHHEIVARFGRFPHRNKILGRDSTEEEQAFLQQPGSSF